jgi:hypothetical protein
MSTLVCIVNDILIRNRSAWYGFFILFVLAFFIRLLPSFVSDTGLIYIADLASRSIWIMFYVFLVIIFVNYLVFDTQKHEIIFYKSLGTGIVQQFFIKLIVLLSYAFLLTALFWIILWSLEIRYTMMILVFPVFILMTRLIALYIKNIWIYYSAFLLAVISIFYPIYIYPNAAYILKAPLINAAIYVSLYFVLYVLLALKFYVSSWRRECIGLN